MRVPAYAATGTGQQTALRSRRLGLLSGVLLLMLFAATVPLGAQEQIPTNLYRPHPEPTVLPVVYFRSVNWGASPPEYSLQLDATGDIVYVANPQSEAETGAPYEMRFTATDSLRQKIFNLAEQTPFPSDSGWMLNPDLPGNFYTLRYSSTAGEKRFSYRKTTSQQIDQLTTIFEKIAATMQFGRELTALHAERSPQLGAELKRMQDKAAKGELLELQSVAPMLQQVVADNDLPPDLREQAQRVLKEIPAGQE